MADYSFYPVIRDERPAQLQLFVCASAGQMNLLIGGCITVINRQGAAGYRNRLAERKAESAGQAAGLMGQSQLPAGKAGRASMYKSSRLFQAAVAIQHLGPCCQRA